MARKFGQNNCLPTLFEAKVKHSNLLLEVHLYR